MLGIIFFARCERPVLYAGAVGWKGGWGLSFFFFSRGGRRREKEQSRGGVHQMSDLYLSVPLCSDYDFDFFPFCMYAILAF